MTPAAPLRRWLGLRSGGLLGRWLCLEVANSLVLMVEAAVIQTRGVWLSARVTAE